MENSDYITTKQAASLLGLTEYTIRKKVRNKELNGIQGENDRDGYKIDIKSVYDYAMKNKIAITDTITTGTTATASGGAIAATAAGVVSSLALGYVPAAFAVGLGGLLAGLGLTNDNNKGSIKGSTKLYDLGVERLEAEIEGLDLQIKALELEDSAEQPSVETQKRINELQISKNVLNKKIKEIEIQKEIDLGHDSQVTPSD